MRPAHPVEQAVGMDVYVSETDGTGGYLREREEDFRVREIERFEAEPETANPDAYPHVCFRATLRGWDTNEFAGALSNALGISRERISWAGTKDKRAVTTQLFTVRGIDPEAIPTLSGTDVEVLGRTGRAIEFGDLAGNAFDVVIRDPEAPERVDPIRRELAAFATGNDPPGGERTAESGADDDTETTLIAVPNYFGQQRFGSYRPITHEVGLAIVRDDWEGAVMAYLGKPHPTEPESTQEARRVVEETRDWTAALERFSGGLRYERSLLHELAEADGEPTESTFRDALDRFPRNLQRMLVHAAQSFLFNRILSERLQRDVSIHRPVAGDVVCFTDRGVRDSKSHPASLSLPDVDRTQRVTERRVDAVARHCERGRAFVTLPLVGTDTELADGEPGEIERAVLAEHDISPADFDLPEPYGSTGTRRAALCRTDLSIATEPLTLSFSLPKGSYATVVAREFLKTDPTAMG